MKKLTILLIFLASVSCFSQSIKSNGTIDIGWKDGQSCYYMDSMCYAYNSYRNSLFADINLEFSWKFIKVNQQLNNTFTHKKAISFRPVDIQYTTTIRFEYRNFSIGYLHSCTHPVISKVKDLNNGYIRGGEDRIFVRFKW